MSTETRSKDTKSSLAHRAQQKYNAGKFSEAVDALEELSSEVGSQRDLQIQHNLVLSNFVARKTSAKDFEQNLRNLLYSTNTLASDENGGKGESGRAIAFLRYNLAAALFSQKQYGAAAAVLETLFRRLGALDERVAMHVCFLFLDVILHSNRGGITTERERYSSLRKAQSILSYLEKPHSFNGQHGASEATGGYAAAVTGGATPELSGTDRARKEAQHLEVIEFRFRLHLYKAKLVLLRGQLKTAKKEVKSALEIFQKEIKSKGTQDEKLDENGMSLAIHSCSKSSTGLGQPPLGVQNSTALFLKANLEYLRKNYKKCVKLLASCTLQAVDESVFLNNMGCIHFQMGQRKAAHSYFSRALQATYRSASASASAGVSVSCSTQAEVLYNNGVQLLVQGQLSLAFRCFHSASKFFFNRPKLWLRLGECCTAAFAQQQRQSASAGYRSGLIKGVVGFGCHRRVLLSTSRPVSASQDIDLPEPMGRPHRGTNGHAADGTPKMNLPFAAKCFKNVILLCHQLLESEEATSGSSTPNGTASDKLKDDAAVDAIRQKALVNLAYVYLSMYEPQLALSTANDLLALPSISKTHRFLARSYAAEALCMLSRAMEATRVLQSERELMELAGDYAQESGVQLSRARAGVHVNNATTLLLQSRVSEAEESVTRAVRENPSCRESLELLVYVLLKKGDTKKALRVLKEAQVAQ